MGKTYGNLRILSLSPEQGSIKLNSVISEIQQNGFSTDSPFTIGKIENEIKRFARENGIELSGDEIVMTVKQISHSERGSKEKDGKTISSQHLAELSLRRDKMEIYHDDKAFIYSDRERGCVKMREDTRR